MKPHTNPPHKYLIDPEPPTPLSKWNHYRIIKIIERKIQKYLHDLGELEDSNPQKYHGYLLGIRIGYSIYVNEGTDDPEIYSMAFGYVAEDGNDTWLEHYKNSGPDLNPKDTDNPLTDEFIDELYTDVANYIKANIDNSVETFTVLLETAVSGSIKKKGGIVADPGEMNVIMRVPAGVS